MRDIHPRIMRENWRNGVITRSVPKLMCLLLSCVAACSELPRDAHGTLEKILQEKQIQVGVIEHRPWAYRIRGGAAGGSEVEIVEQFAKELGVVVDWKFLPESEAAALLERRELDLILGGIKQSNPRKAEVAFTRPYLSTVDPIQDTIVHHVLAVPKGENALLVRLEKFLKDNVPASTAPGGRNP